MLEAALDAQPERARHALLIGVSEYDEAALFSAPIPADVIAEDLRRMRQALREAGYRVSVLGSAIEPLDNETFLGADASRGRCKTAVRDAATAVPEGGVLLIYFTGHGLSLDGREYLAPADAGSSGGPGRADADSLIAVDLATHVRGCQAALVILATDACRDAENPAPDIAAAPLPSLSRGTFVRISGCGPGQTCGYDAGGSHFTRAFAEALSANHPARRVEELVRATRAAVAPYGQSPQAHSASGLGAGDAALPVCEGGGILHSWVRAAGNCALWDLVDGESRHARERITETVASWARLVSEIATSERLGGPWLDPWQDNALVDRVLAATALLADSGSSGRLPMREVELFVLAPFLAELSHGLGRYDVPDVHPGDLSRTFAPGLRFDLEAVHETYEQVRERAAALSDEDPARQALTAWLVNRWLVDREDVWDQETLRSAATAAVANLPDGEGDGALDLRRRARAVARPERADAPDSSPPERLLALAATIAADPRRAPAVVAEQLGVRDGLTVGDALDAARSTHWAWRDNTLELRAHPKHPALFLWLEDLTARADAIVKVGSVGLLPEQVVASGLRPALGRDDRPRYEVPIRRFRVVPDKVLRLLSGTELYDDPAMALRELYQNAVDACRYRLARYRYAYADDNDQIPWTPSIRLALDEDEDGRFLDCEDNGVGMDAEVIADYFSAAGARFVHRAGFQREQARWGAKDPNLRIYPNSRFGIGVLAYFLLAEEVQVRSVPTDEAGGRLESGFQARLAGAGGILELGLATDLPPGIRAGGTRIRLRLRPDAELDLRAAVRKFIAVPTFKLTVVERGQPDESLTPGRLYHRHRSSAGGSDDDARAQAVPPQAAGTHLWWVGADGYFLIDGIPVDKGSRRSRFRMRSSGHFVRGDHGFVLNLTDQHQPRLTMDRREILDMDQTFVQRELRLGLDALQEWPGMTLPWIWRMAVQSPDIVADMFERLDLSDVPVSLRPGAPRINLERLGCWPSDGHLFGQGSALRFQGNSWGSPTQDQSRAWRYKLWQSEASDVPLAVTPPSIVPDDLSGHPLGRHEPARFPSACRDEDDAYRALVANAPFAITGADLRPLRRLRQLAGAPGWFVERVPELADATDQESARRAFLEICLVAGAQPGAVREWFATEPELVSMSPADELLFDAATWPVTEQAEIDTIDWKIFSSEKARHAKLNWSPARVHAVARELTLPATEIARRLDRLRGLGVWSSLSEARAAEIEEPPAGGIEAILFDLDHDPEPREIVNWAITFGEAPSAFARSLQDCAHSLGLRIVIPDPASLPGRVAQRYEAVVASRVLAAQGQAAFSAWIRSLWQLPADLEPGQRREAVVFTAVALTEQPRLHHVQALSSIEHGWAAEMLVDLLGDSVPVDPSLGNAIDRTIDFSRIWLDERGRRVPVLPVRLAEFARDANKVLLASEDGAWALERLAFRLESLGEPLGEGLSDLLDAQLGDEEVALCRLDLGAGNEQPLTVGPVEPMHLVRAAGRFGWSLRATWDRLHRLRAFHLQLPFARDRCPEGIVHWQDLIALSAECDGWPPAVGRRVDTEHLQRAAGIIGETTAQTHARLRRYAQLFSLDLEALGSDEPASER